MQLKNIKQNKKHGTPSGWSNSFHAAFKKLDDVGVPNVILLLKRLDSLGKNIEKATLEIVKILNRFGAAHFHMTSNIANIEAVGRSLKEGGAVLAIISSSYSLVKNSLKFGQALSNKAEKIKHFSKPKYLFYKGAEMVLNASIMIIASVILSFIILGATAIATIASLGVSLLMVGLSAVTLVKSIDKLMTLEKADKNEKSDEKQIALKNKIMQKSAIFILAAATLIVGIVGVALALSPVVLIGIGVSLVALSVVSSFLPDRVWEGIRKGFSSLKKGILELFETQAKKDEMAVSKRELHNDEHHGSQAQENKKPLGHKEILKNLDKEAVYKNAEENKGASLIASTGTCDHLKNSTEALLEVRVRQDRMENMITEESERVHRLSPCTAALPSL